jgi:hypothetical protein
MKEESVFWLGGKPGAPKEIRAAPAAEQLAPAIRGACEALGLQVDDFLASLGGYGSWLVHFSREGRRERIVWNGREKKLVLQASIRSGGWEDLRDCPVGEASEPGFVAAIDALLSAAPPRAG